MMRFFRLRKNKRHSSDDDNTTSLSQAEARLRLPMRKKPIHRLEGSNEEPEYEDDDSHDDNSQNIRNNSDNDEEDDDEVDSVSHHLQNYDMDDLVLGELLGQGTFATVHAIVCFATPPSARLGHNNSQGNNNFFATDYALKRLHPNKAFGNPAAVVADLATEAWLLHRLPHPHMVALHALVDDGPTRKGLVIDRLVSTLREERRRWYKWAPHGSKDDWNVWRLLRPKTYQHVEGLRTQVALDVTSALQHLHAHNICHRDVKPSNVGFDAVRISQVVLVPFLSLDFSHVLIYDFVFAMRYYSLF